MNLETERILTIDSPPLLGFKSGLNDCIQQLLSKMKEKNSIAGEVTAKIIFDLDKQQITDGETGEVIEVYVPNIGHKIKTKIAVNTAETKGLYLSNNLALESNESGWSWIDINNQESLFD